MARRFEEAAQDVGYVVTGLRDVEGVQWQSTAAEAFREQLDEVRVALIHAAQSLREAAAAWASHGSSVDRQGAVQLW
jgi:hypothetical protein